MRKVSLLCALGIHNDLSQNAYYKAGFDVCGEVKVCVRCGRITTWGNVVIPAHFEKISRGEKND